MQSRISRFVAFGGGVLVLLSIVFLPWASYEDIDISSFQKLGAIAYVLLGTGILPIILFAAKSIHKYWMALAGLLNLGVLLWVDFFLREPTAMLLQGDGFQVMTRVEISGPAFWIALVGACLVLASVALPGESVNP